jgi:hypothetical protein
MNVQHVKSIIYHVNIKKYDLINYKVHGCRVPEPARVGRPCVWWRFRAGRWRLQRWFCWCGTLPKIYVPSTHSFSIFLVCSPFPIQIIKLMWKHYGNWCGLVAVLRVIVNMDDASAQPVLHVAVYSRVREVLFHRQCKIPSCCPALFGRKWFSRWSNL